MLTNVPESLILNLHRAEFIAFDNDGTLFNGLDISWLGFKNAWEIVNHKHALTLPIPTRDAFKNQIGKPAHEFFPGLLPEGFKHLGSELHQAIAEHEINAIESKQGKLYEGVLETLEALKKRGYKLLLVSNASNEYFNACVENLGYKKFLDGWYCVGTSGKNKNEILQDAMRKHGFKNGVMVGDRISDVNAGKTNDLKTIGVSYGYGTETELKDADVIIANPLELLHIF